MENDCFGMLLCFCNFTSQALRQYGQIISDLSQPSSCNRKYRQVVQVYLVMFAILPQVAMVNMQMFVSSPDLTTPHGGAPFQGWRKGRWPYRALGPWGSHVLETQDGHTSMDQVPK